MEERIPVCNFDIELKGWKEPFKNLADFLRMAEKARSLSRLQGEHVLFSDRSLGGGHVNGLHVFKAELDLDAPGYVHLHYVPNGGILDVGKEKGTFYLRGFGDNPVHTLTHLYESLPNQKGNTKREAMADQIKLHSSHNIDKFLEDSLSGGRTKFKLLEQKYRTFVSNQ